MKGKNLILTIVLISFLLVAGYPAYAVGEPQITNNGKEAGLVITAPLNPVDISNLNPGDTKVSQLLLTNNGSDPFQMVSIRTHILPGSENSPRGGALADILRLTIRDGNTIIVDNLTFREAAALLNQTLGSMAVGEQKVLDFTVYFPGREAGNEYQGASFQVKWIFNIIIDPSNPGEPGDPGGPGDPADPGDPGNSDLISEDEPTPLGSPEEGDLDEDEIIVVIEEKFPLGPAMPRTGEKSPMYFYAAGVLIALAGVAVRQKK